MYQEFIVIKRMDISIKNGAQLHSLLCLQEDKDVKLDSLTPDGQPAYWTQHYRLRGAVSSSSSSSQVDVPEFLASSKEAILVTGELAVLLAQDTPVMRTCTNKSGDASESRRYTPNIHQMDV